MKPTALKIKNFRTITNEQIISFRNGATIVGPNNSGKSNTLLALYYFFTGFDNKHGYKHTLDLPYGQESVQTSLNCQFELDINHEFDRNIFEKIRKLKTYLAEYKADESGISVSLNLVFRGSTPVYQLFPGIKQNKTLEYAKLHKNIIEEILNHFRCYHIPSEKSTSKVYHDFILPFIKKKIALAISPYDTLIKNSIHSLSESMNQVMNSSNLGEVKVLLEYPENALENLIAGLELQVKDTTTSSIYSKGMGIQSAVLFSALEWVTLQQPDHHVIWLIEEPETYMHPSLAYKTCKIIDRISKVSTTIKTTHSLSFIPDEVGKITGIEVENESKSSILGNYTTLNEATSAIRKSLGVKFSDYFGLSELNIFVEGKTDIEYLTAAIKSYQIKYNQKLFIGLGEIKIISFGGCTDLAGFIKANYEHISKEAVAIALFDGDSAGRDQTHALRSFFSNKGGFSSDRDYTSVPGNGEIENLFPDEWVKNAREVHPAWFEDYEDDAAGVVTKIKIHKSHKTKFMRAMIEIMSNPYDDNHPTKFDPLIEKLEELITKGLKRLFPERYATWTSEISLSQTL
ncbi:ATP-dependent nuclease [Pseudomonas gingeri]|uniref:ATP-dependent nuclease n=1 Tax=Pseudomonas gingeri TaxID=117681 RepID=UPI0015A42820|nr:AAA family ATPase [Pseudomonas gingeri]NWA07939.1 AAA family ATPase [Pseudomonas gingeri]